MKSLVSHFESMIKLFFKCQIGETRLAVTDVECHAPKWASWQPETICFNGEQAFSRKCLNYTAGYYESIIFPSRCPGNSTKNVDCDWVWSNWSQGSVCSANCCLVQTTRIRSCNETDKSVCEFFEESAMETRYCQIRNCDLHWSEWSVKVDCSSECGLGLVIQSRTCTSKDKCII